MRHRSLRSPGRLHRPSAGCLLLLAVLAASCGEPGGEEAHQQHGGEHDQHAGHTAEGTAGLVRITPAQRAVAGVTVAVAKPAEIRRTLRLVAHVDPNADTTTHANPRVGGLVRRIHKGLGDTVEAGEALAEIESVPLAEAAGTYLARSARVEAAEETLEQERRLFKERLEAAERLADGTIAVARRIYEREERLQEEGIATMRPFLEAEKALEQARLEKRRDLTRLRAERDARLLQVRVELRRARIDRRAAADRLRALGLDKEAIAALSHERGGFGRYTVKASRKGVIVARHITLDEFVDTETTLFEIHDLDTVWVIGSAYEKHLSSLRKGQKALVRVDAHPDAVFEGRVAFIGYQISPDSRTIPVRVTLENKGLPEWPEPYPLRPGMFGSVEVVLGVREAPVTIPEAAVVHEDELDYVFVREQELVYHRHPVRVRGEGDTVEVVEGLEAGMEVAVGGTFLLKSLVRSEELGGGHSH